MLRDHGARLCVAIHARMPPAARQSVALHAMDATEDEGDDWRLKGPLVVRWSLASGFRYEDAKNRYAPFDRLIDPDIPTRGTLVHLIHVALKSGQPSFVIVNNKAEGCAPAERDRAGPRGGRLIATRARSADYVRRFDAKVLRNFTSFGATTNMQ